jgi:hypothetical protein
MMPQGALSIIAPVIPSLLPDLEALLQRMAADPATNDVIPFGRIPGTHYARVFTVAAGTGASGEHFAPLLVLMSDLDGSPYRYLKSLVTLSPSGLDALFGHCEGYPVEARGRTDRARVVYLRSHMVPANTAYVNRIGRTVEQIRGEAHLRDAIEDFLDAKASRWTGADDATVRAAIQDFVTGTSDLTWAKRPAGSLNLRARVQDIIDLLTLPAIGLIFLPVLTVVLPIWIVLLRYKEWREPAPHVTPTPDHVRELAALEDHGPQNQFSAVGVIKPGWFRSLTVMAVFRVAAYGTRHIFNHGSLGGVKTIHFARWVSIDSQKRAIFVSNYDGSLESYMDDFIDQLFWGLNAVFSNGVGYPKTTFLLFGGARNELQFKDYLRVHQIPTQVWFAAYGDLTALNIENNARVRAGLFGPQSESETREWLQRL